MEKTLRVEGILVLLESTCCVIVGSAGEGRENSVKLYVATVIEQWRRKFNFPRIGLAFG